MHVLVIPANYPDETNDSKGCFFRDQVVALNDSGCRVGVLIPPVLYSWLKIRNFSKLPFGHSTLHDGAIPVLRHFSILWIPLCKYFYIKASKYYALKMYQRYVSQYGKPDFIHAHCVFYAGIIAHAIHKKHGTSYFLTEHSTAYQRHLLNQQELYIASTVAGAAQKCLAVSKPFVEKLDQTVGITGGWKYVPNVLAAEYQNTFFAMPEFNPEEFNFCNVSWLSPKKNINLLLYSFRDAFKDDLSVTLSIAGDGEQKQELELLSKELGLERQVQFLGRLSRDAVRDLMVKSHVYVSSSDVETFGVTLIEMLSVGRPVIATRSGGPESIIEHRDGILVPVGDRQALSDAMQCVKNQYAQYDFQKIRERCLARFGSNAVATQLREIYVSAFPADKCNNHDGAAQR